MSLILPSHDMIALLPRKCLVIPSQARQASDCKVKGPGSRKHVYKFNVFDNLVLAIFELTVCQH